MVGAPVIHYVVCAFERSLSCCARCKIGTWPCIIRPFPNLVRHLFGQGHGPPLCYLNDRSDSFYHINTDHGCRHFTSGKETGGISAAAEVSKVRRRPLYCLQACVNIILPHLIERLHDSISIFILHLSTGINGTCS